jgi:RNA recognition motif-containing protein
MSFDGEGSDRTVFVGGVSPKATEEGLKQFFESNFGEVDSSKIIYDRSTGRSKGYGFVTFRDVDTAERVRNSSGLVFLGKVLNIGNAYRRHTRRYSGGGYASPAESTVSSSPPTADYGGGYGGYATYGAYNPYYASTPYWPPQAPPTAGESAAVGSMTATPEQIQAYQAQLQAMMQAQMTMWQQMQQNPSAMQQFASQFQAMSLSHQPPTHAHLSYPQQQLPQPLPQPQLQLQPQIHTSPPAPALVPVSPTLEKSSNGNGKSESNKTE